MIIWTPKYFQPTVTFALAGAPLSAKEKIRHVVHTVKLNIRQQKKCFKCETSFHSLAHLREHFAAFNADMFFFNPSMDTVNVLLQHILIAEGLKITYSTNYGFSTRPRIN